MSVKNVLVTGGCGFVGERIVQHLLEQFPSCKITVLDKAGATSKDKLKVEYVQVDITSAEAVQAFFHDRPDPFQAVCHVAGISPPLSERYSRRIDDLVFNINVEGTRNVLSAAQQSGVTAFVYTGSVCAVTDDFTQHYANIDERWPVVQRGQATSYGESKAAAEHIVLSSSTSTFRTCTLRPSVIFGEGDYQFIPNIVNCIVHKNESPYRLGDGMNLWDTTYVGNVADAHILALTNLLSDAPTANGEAIFIANEEPVSGRDFMLQTWKEFNGHIPPFEIPIPLRLAWVMGALCEVYTWITGKPSTLCRGSVCDAVAMRYVNGEKARRCLGYAAKIGTEEALKRTCQWMRDNNIAANLTML